MNHKVVLYLYRIRILCSWAQQQQLTAFMSHDCSSENERIFFFMALFFNIRLGGALTALFTRYKAGARRNILTATKRPTTPDSSSGECNSREEGVQHALSRQQRVVGRQLLRHGSHLTHRPHLQHGVLRLLPVKLRLQHDILRGKKAVMQDGWLAWMDDHATEQSHKSGKLVIAQNLFSSRCDSYVKVVKVVRRDWSVNHCRIHSCLGYC